MGTLDNDRAHLQRWISDPQQDKPGVQMPSTPLPPADLDALLAYLGGLR
jgi:cytochrome c oxidase subunit 2